MLALGLPSGYLVYGLVQDQLFLTVNKDVSGALARAPGVIVLAKDVSLPQRELSLVVGGDAVAPAEVLALQRRLRGDRFLDAKLIFCCGGQVNSDTTIGFFAAIFRS